MYRAAAWVVGAVLGAVLLALVFTLGYVTNAGDDGAATSVQVDTDTGDSSIDFSTLEEIVDILRREYFGRDTLDEELLFEAAIRGMMDSLADTGTFYIDPTSFALSLGPSGSFEGIGATVNQQDNEIVIVNPFEGSPAIDAGLVAGDIILAVDGESIVGWPLDRAVLRVRGEKGSEVVLTIRHIDGEVEDFTIVRDEIRVDSVTTSPPGGVLRDGDGNEATDMAYLRILQFTEMTPNEVEAVVSQAVADGKQGLVIDLRGNPGGLFNQTLDTTDLFLDEGIMLIELSDDDEETVYRARPGGVGTEIPIVVLVDRFSASGSEVLSAALKDNGRATIMGETSFGKGTVNRSRSLQSGGAIFVTIRHWLTPNGVQIDGVGIRPDIEISPSPFDPLYDALADTQIYAAIDHLRGLAATIEPAPSSVAP